MRPESLRDRLFTLTAAAWAAVAACWPPLRASESARLLIALAFALVQAPASADPGYYVVTPYDRKGLWTAELRYWTFKPSDEAEVIWPELGLGYGINTRWTTLLLASYVGTTHKIERSTLNWQNVVLLTQGEWPVDLALYGAWIRSPDRQYFSHATEWGPMLQTDLGRAQLNLNLIFEHVSGTGTASPTTLKYQWQVKQRLVLGWQAGFQGFGELGPWDDWAPASSQSHRAGPALFVQVPGANGRGLELQVAALFGRTYARSGHMFSMRAAYNF